MQLYPGHSYCFSTSSTTRTSYTRYRLRLRHEPGALVDRKRLCTIEDYQTMEHNLISDVGTRNILPQWPFRTVEIHVIPSTRSERGYSEADTCMR